MIAAMAAGLTLLGTAITGFFGFKEGQANVLARAVDVVADVSASNAQREHAIATIIAAEANSGYWLAAIWRPLLMVFFAVLLGSWWFGYTPPNIDNEMSPAMAEVFSILKIGIGGYIPARTIEKIVHDINIGQVLKKFIDKKIA